MIEKLNKKSNYKNILRLKESCNKECNVDESNQLKKLYMNKYGMYMSSRIITVLLIEFMAIIVIMNTGIDSTWAGTPYADTIIYGTMWGFGGIYLLQMMIRVVLNTYSLKIALENGQVKVSDCSTSLSSNGYSSNIKNANLEIYINLNRKNELLYINQKKLKKALITTNIKKSDNAGTKLLIYDVNDKKNDIFIMVKGRLVDDSADKTVNSIVYDKLLQNKYKLRNAKTKFKKNKR